MVLELREAFRQLSPEGLGMASGGTKTIRIPDVNSPQVG